MIFAYVCMILGVASLFTDWPVTPVIAVVALASGAMYVRTMHRRARGDVR